jgi:hypothetical protein
MTSPTPLHSCPEPRPFVVEGPSALIACAPFLLGFRPENSVLVVFTNERGIVLSLRFDLVESADDDVLHDTGNLFITTMQQIATNGVDVTEAFVLLFTPDAKHCPGREILTVIGQVLDDHGVVCEQWLATDDHGMWCYSIGCHLCPGVGHEFDDDQAARASFEMVSRGYGYAPNREALEDSVTVVHDRRLSVEVMREAEDHFTPDDPQCRLRVEHELVSAVRTPVDCDHIRTAGPRWAVALADSRVREPFMFRVLVEPAGNRRAALAGARAWLTELVRCLDDAWVAPVAATLAAVSWQEGDGAFARIAADRALRADPTQNLAHLIDTAAGSGVPPSAWRDILLTFGLHALRIGAELPQTEPTA